MGIFDSLFGKRKMDVSREDNDFEQLRNSIFERAYDQAISEYGSWEKYKKEQWKSLLNYGIDDLLDLSLALLSSSRRVKYPIAALDLAAYTIKKFELDTQLVDIPIMRTVHNTRTGEIDPVQFISLKVKFNAISAFRLHLGVHILARCALLSNDPLGYLSNLGKNINSDIISSFTEREFNNVINHKCPYEEEAEKYCSHWKDGLERAKDYFYKESLLPDKIKEEIEGEVLIEEEIAKAFRKR